jgi:hypothetical protein
MKKAAQTKRRKSTGSVGNDKQEEKIFYGDGSSIDFRGRLAVRARPASLRGRYLATSSFRKEKDTTIVEVFLWDAKSGGLKRSLPWLAASPALAYCTNVKANQLARI